MCIRDSFEGAREKLARVVDGSAGGTRTMLDLRTEALVDLTRVYVRLERRDDRLAYFQRTTQELDRRARRTRQTNTRAGAVELRAARKISKPALHAEPLAPEAATWQQAVMR